MVVGVEAVRLVLISHGMVDVMRGAHIGTLCLPFVHSPSSCLESVSVSRTDECLCVLGVGSRAITVIESHAIVNLHGGGTRD